MTTSNRATELELLKQLRRAIASIKHWCDIAHRCNTQLPTQEERRDALEAKADDVAHDISSEHAVATTLVLGAVLLLDYLLLFAIVSFLLEVVYVESVTGWGLAAARIVIPFAVIAVELTLAHFRARSRAAGWIVASAVFALVVPAALVGTLVGASVSNPDFSVAPPVFWLLVLFVAVLGGVPHALIIFGGEYIILSVEILRERHDRDRAIAAIGSLQRNGRAASESAGGAYGAVFRPLVYKLFELKGGEPYNSQTPFSQDEAEILSKMYPNDADYLSGKSALYHVPPEDPHITNPVEADGVGSVRGKAMSIAGRSEPPIATLVCATDSE